ncbi:serine/threonine-protein kinase [Dictyobacter arantiisoli]|uniref:non-specific serine/threonine protein kinase n=1 Tax=Dictyobacter arantiisoli TaxID=2014874 RepID=A0A5A5T6F9_9CHLR|nr:serine/threonine-protein kinase [Dictyobacter arantiisoli]GCF06603.1 hypothetical protein KDI_01670 [Dictyobacter arantiisoli]
MNAEDLCGKVLGTCTLEKIIGRGGMGAVYLAQQSRPRRQVAVKVLLPITTLQPHQQAAFLERFRRETDAAASLEHPNITPVHEYGERDGLTYLVMPYVSGGTLRDELDTEGKLPLTRVVSYLEQMAAALDFAHERNVVHRDIKPANILMTPGKRLLLTDFGLVKIITDGQNQNPLSEVGMPMGTPDYMAPEQVVGGEVDARADIYSLGVLLYHMVTGTPPFQGETPMKVALQHLHTPPPLPRNARPDLPPAAEQVMLRALAKRPVDRYERARNLASAFRLALEAAGVQVDNSGMNNEGNRRRGLFDPVWRSSLPNTPEPAIHATPDVPTNREQNPAQARGALHDIVAQTSMTMPSFSGILTEVRIPMIQPHNAQQGIMPQGSLLDANVTPEKLQTKTTAMGHTPLPSTMTSNSKQATQAPAAYTDHTPLPTVYNPPQAPVAPTRSYNEQGIIPERPQKLLFTPNRLSLRQKTSLRSIQSTQPQRVAPSSQAQIQPRPDAPAHTGTTGELKQLAGGNTHQTPNDTPLTPRAQKIEEVKQQLQHVLSSENINALPGPLPGVVAWIKKNVKIVIIAAVIILIALSILIYALSTASSTPSTSTGLRQPETRIQQISTDQVVTLFSTSTITVHRETVTGRLSLIADVIVMKHTPMMAGER